MKHRHLLLGAIVLAFVNAAQAQLAGEYVDDKFLNGHATIHVSVRQTGSDVSISFHGSHNDTPEVGLHFTATGKTTMPDDHVFFKFEDSCKNSGEGLIDSGKNTLTIGLRVEHINDFSCLVFYREGMV